MDKKLKYTKKLFEIVCERIASGKSLRAICQMDDMPRIGQVMYWLDQDDKKNPYYKGIAEQYARAREAQADVIFDECIDIADDSGLDTAIDPLTKAIIVKGEAIQRAKLRIDTRRWMAGKLRPKKYGEKYLVGSDPENPIPSAPTTVINVTDSVVNARIDKIESDY